MKIRILDDQVRLRLGRQEVERIGRGEPVDAETRFPGGGCFRYRLVVGAAEPDAVYSGDTMEVRLPAALAHHWAGTDSEVSIDRTLPTDRGSLRILVEKDMECLEPRPGESRANRFPNPKAPA